MRIHRIKIDGYKSLKSFEANFTNEKTVIIGQNASGKSNFLEAIVLIFRNLDYNWDPEFDFTIHYTLNENKGNASRKDILIKGFKDGKTKYSFWNLSDKTDENINSLFNNNEDKGNVSRSDFKENKNTYLPKHIFVYYSGLGNSNRLEEILDKPDYDYAKSLMEAKEDDSIPLHRRFFYVRLHHSQFVLLSFYGLEMEERTESFLRESLKIEELESILFILKEPYWGKTKRIKEGEDKKFWGSIGIVKIFLSELYKIATAPIREERDQRISIWKTIKEERLFLYISNIKKIKEIVKKKGWDNIQFFNVLESINKSDLHREIRLRIRKNHAGNITFKDLSEGEQQLLTVLGLMRFTRYEESLYLLDEPDTHLNPYWRWKYLDFISEIADKPGNSQVIMTSHDPLTIGSLSKEEVRIFKEIDGVIKSKMPNEDPKGMGSAGILTEIFGLETTLDRKTHEQLERRRHIESMLYNLEKFSYKIPSNEDLESLKKELVTLNKDLDNLGFSRVTRDPLYQKFQAKFDKEMNYKKSQLKPLTTEEQMERDALMEKILKELFEEEGL